MTFSSKSRWIILILSLAVMIGLLPGQQNQPQHDALSYDVNVSAQIIPIYAVDDNGNPVFDLKEEDVELFIDGKPQKLLFFMNYQVQEAAKDVGTADPSTVTPEKKKNRPSGFRSEQPQPQIKKEEEIKPASPERIVIIILDGISNSKSGVRRAKKLAQGLIRSGGPGDAFVIFISHVRKGLQYICGPEKNKTKLLSRIAKLYQNPQWIIMVPRKNFLSGESPDPGAVMMWNHLNRMFGQQKIDNTNQYRMSLNRFSRSLSELKNALKTIRLPKHIFLVSGGVQEMAKVSNTITDTPGNSSDFDDTSIMAYYGMLTRAAVSINQGGSLLYLVNPIPDTHKNRKAVHIMSKISNAKCITGDTVENLLNNVKKNTAAYYEIAYSITKDMDENFRIQVKCKRDGIRLNTLKFGEKSRPYAQMEDPMKKMFAMNVVMGGSWAQIVAKISVAQSTTTNRQQNDANSIAVKTVKVNIPDALQGQMIDVFTLNVEPKTLKATIQLSKRLATATETIDVPVEPDRKQFFVIVEPKSTQCIVNRVR